MKATREAVFAAVEAWVTVAGRINLLEEGGIGVDAARLSPVPQSCWAVADFDHFKPRPPTLLGGFGPSVPSSGG